MLPKVFMTGSAALLFGGAMGSVVTGYAATAMKHLQGHMECLMCHDDHTKTK